MLTALFTERRDLLKARSALMALDLVLRSTPRPSRRCCSREVERILSGAHEFAELAPARAPCAPAPSRCPSEQRAEAERLLGGDGSGAVRPARGWPRPPPRRRCVRPRSDAMTRWRRRAENPVSARAVADAARVIVRTCEGILATLPERPTASSRYACCSRNGCRCRDSASVARLSAGVGLGLVTEGGAQLGEQLAAAGAPRRWRIRATWCSTVLAEMNSRSPISL